MVAPCLASPAMLSASGTFVRDSALVIMMVCVTPGSVSCVPRAADDARNDVTPGTTTDLMPLFASSSICSLMAPYMAGSPSCRRSTVFFPSAEAPLYRISDISSLTSPDASCSSAFLPAIAIMGSGMSDPEYTMTSAFRMSLLAFTVTSSGSPGPHPTKYTVFSGTLYHQN